MVNTELLDDLQYLGGVFVEIEQQFNEADYSDFLQNEVPVIEELHQEAFAGERSPGGEPWKPLAPSTIQRKGHDRILVETDAMRSSLAGQTGDSIREVVSEPLQHGLSFGTRDFKSPFHQEGTGRIPQREHVGVNGEYVDGLAERVATETTSKLTLRK